MNQLEARTCAVCGAERASMRARASHEAMAHPGWSPSADLQRARTNYKNQAWKKAQGRGYSWMSHANTTAQAHGLEPLPIRTPLPIGPCAYCGGEADGWDHVVPFAKGGAHTLANIIPACFPCNQRKNRYGAHVFDVPRTLSLLCGWCWEPVTRQANQLRGASFVACSRRCIGKVSRNPLPFGRTWRPDCRRVVTV